MIILGTKFLYEIGSRESRPVQGRAKNPVLEFLREHSLLIFLFVTGIGWTLVGLIILRFDYTSVSAISILFGFVAIGAGVVEIGMTMLAQGWWKLLYGALALIFIVTGIVSFIHPGDTFLALAAVISFFLVLAGTFDIIVAISTRREISAWWLQLVSGIIDTDLRDY